MLPEELRAFDGTDPTKPLYLAVRGTVFDVTKGAQFYGPGAPYSVFAGRDCARALGLMKIEEAECTDDVSGLTEHQLDTLMDWEAKFRQRYPVVGQVVQRSAQPPAQCTSSAQPEAGVVDAPHAIPKIVHDEPYTAGRHVAASHHYLVPTAIAALLVAVLIASLLRFAV